MNPCFLLAYGVGIESLSASIFIFMNFRFIIIIMHWGNDWYYLYALGKWLVLLCTGEMTGIIIHWGSDRFSVPYACVGICILRDVFYEAYYTCLLPCMRNVYITCLSFSFKHVVYFLECVRDPVYFIVFR